MTQKKSKTLKRKSAPLGRPPKGADARIVPLMVKATAKERAIWERRAKAAGMTLGAWLAQPRRDEMKREE